MSKAYKRLDTIGRLLGLGHHAPVRSGSVKVVLKVGKLSIYFIGHSEMFNVWDEWGLMAARFPDTDLGRKQLTEFIHRRVDMILTPEMLFVGAYYRGKIYRRHPQTKLTNDRLILRIRDGKVWYHDNLNPTGGFEGRVCTIKSFLTWASNRVSDAALVYDPNRDE